MASTETTTAFAINVAVTCQQYRDNKGNNKGNYWGYKLN